MNGSNGRWRVRVGGVGKVCRVGGQVNVARIKGTHVLELFDGVRRVSVVLVFVERAHLGGYRGGRFHEKFRVRFCRGSKHLNSLGPQASELPNFRPCTDHFCVVVAGASKGTRQGGDASQGCAGDRS